MHPPKVGNPVPSEDLADEAVKAGFERGEVTRKDKDTHLPASESDGLPGEAEDRPLIERNIGNLAPG